MLYPNTYIFYNCSPYRAGQAERYGVIHFTINLLFEILPNQKDKNYCIALNEAQYISCDKLL